MNSFRSGPDINDSGGFLLYASVLGGTRNTKYHGPRSQAYSLFFIIVIILFVKVNRFTRRIVEGKRRLALRSDLTLTRGDAFPNKVSGGPAKTGDTSGEISSNVVLKKNYQVTTRVPVIALGNVTRVVINSDRSRGYFSCCSLVAPVFHFPASWHLMWCWTLRSYNFAFLQWFQ